MSSKPWATTDKLKLGIQLSAWGFLILIYGIIFSRYFNFGVSLLRGLLNVLPMMILFYANLYFVNYFIERRRYGLFVLCNLLLLAIMAIIRVEANLLFPAIEMEVLTQNEEERWLIGAVVTNAAILAVSTFYQILLNRYETEGRNLAIIKEQQEAQLQFLRAQINPHFLFNTLNNIYTLAVMKSDQTPEMVMRLSNLLRYVVYDGRAQQVELQLEVNQIQEYTELFQMRSETLLSIQFEREGNIEGHQIEPMILIPLVENALKHCDFDTNPEAFVRILLRVEDGLLHFTTHNSKDDRQSKDKIGGVGLDNIRKRLKLRYEDRYELHTRAEERTFWVELMIRIYT